MNKRYLYPISAIFIAGVILYVTVITVSENDQKEVIGEKQEKIADAPEEIHPVSLQALMQKEFDGRDLLLGQILDENSFYSRYYITYKSGELTISGIMNVPKGSPPAGGFPLLVLNHGFIDPEVYTNGRGLKREQDFFARNGYVVIHPDYRNHSDSDIDDRDELAVRLSYTEDVINAVYAVKNSNLEFINTDKVGMLGHSMGGGVTLFSLVADPGLIDAAVLYAPVTGNLQDSYERWIEVRPEASGLIESLYGSPENSLEFWQNLNSENFYEVISAPIKIFHGTADESVPLSWSEDTKEVLENLGKQVELVVYSGAPHEFGVNWTNFMNSSNEFFTEFLR